MSRSLSGLDRILSDLLSENYEANLEESWENEQTATPVRAFGVRLHQNACSLRDTRQISLN